MKKVFGFRLQEVVSYKDNPREYTSNGVKWLHLGSIFAEGRHFIVYKDIVNNDDPSKRLARIEEVVENKANSDLITSTNFVFINDEDLWEWLVTIANKRGIL